MTVMAGSIPQHNQQAMMGHEAHERVDNEITGEGEKTDKNDDENDDKHPGVFFFIFFLFFLLFYCCLQKTCQNSNIHKIGTWNLCRPYLKNNLLDFSSRDCRG